MKKIYIKDTDKQQLQLFLNNCTDELKNFRYFKKRKLDIVDSHLLSNLVFLNETPIAYFHLEKENNLIWFGICVNKKYQKFGIGSLILNNVISFAKLNNLKSIHLTVDCENIAAINLYTKYKFKIKKISDSIINMVLDL
jgi:RimJ/RimL family protein N-acetyltransferase